MKPIKNKKILIIDQNFILNSKNLKTKSRSLTITPNYINKTVQVHNGKDFIKLTIMKEMVGHKLGEFVKTRKAFKFKKK